jgi:hypothetical protein
MVQRLERRHRLRVLRHVKRNQLAFYRLNYVGHFADSNPTIWQLLLCTPLTGLERRIVK